MSVLIEHIPHIVIAVIMFGVALYLFLENVRSPPEEDTEEGITEQTVRDWYTERARYAQRRVRASVAGPALLLLAVILAATATGILLYADNLASVSRGELIVIAHCVAGVGVLAVFIVKQRRAGRGRLMSAVRHGRMIDVASSTIAMSVLLPLTATGILAILFPSASGISANLHLLTAAWFAAVIVLHLRRYLVGTVRTWRPRRASEQGSTDEAGPLTVTRPVGR